MSQKKKGLALSLDAVLYLLVALILISIAVVLGPGILETARNDRAVTESASLGALISEYKQEVGSYPATLDDLKTASGQYGPWIKEVPKDPWNSGNQYRYKFDDTGFAVYSVGKGKADNSSTKEIGSGNLGFVGR